MKKDIENAEDIKLLVNDFYSKVTADNTLGHIFMDVAKVNWEHHLPVMYAFWESVLFGKMGYAGNPMDAHFKLNEKVTLTADHFNAWKFLFLETVDQHFDGEVAEMAKQKAISIADLMFYKINNDSSVPGVAQPKI
jgi:hemoglobin